MESKCRLISGGKLSSGALMLGLGATSLHLYLSGSGSDGIKMRSVEAAVSGVSAPPRRVLGRLHRE